MTFPHEVFSSRGKSWKGPAQEWFQQKMIKFCPNCCPAHLPPVLDSAWVGEFCFRASVTPPALVLHRNSPWDVPEPHPHPQTLSFPQTSQGDCDAENVVGVSVGKQRGGISWKFCRESPAQPSGWAPLACVTIYLPVWPLFSRIHWPEPFTSYPSKVRGLRLFS